MKTRIRGSNRFSRSPDPEVPDVRPVYYVSRRQTRINIRIYMHCTHRYTPTSYYYYRCSIFKDNFFFPTQSPVSKLHHIYYTPNVRMVLRVRTPLFYILLCYIYIRVVTRHRGGSRTVKKIVGTWVAELRERGVNPCPSIIEFRVFIFKFRVNI